MPVYEYVCTRCAHGFEELVFGGEQPACPRCAAPEVEKKFSVFGTRGASAERAEREAPPSMGSCGTCGDPRGPGACASD